GAGKLGKDIDACFFTFFAQPCGEAIQRDDVIAVVVERRRSYRRTNSVFRRQVQKEVFLHGRLERSALFDKVRNKFLQRARIHHCAGKNVRADGGAFLDHGDLDVAELVIAGGFVVLLDEAREVERAAEVCWSSADEYDVEL